MEKRYFKRSVRYIGKSRVYSGVQYWVWVRGKGLFVKFEQDDKPIKSEYTLPEFLASNENAHETTAEGAREVIL